MMDTLDRYLVREFLLYFLVIVSGLALLFLGIDFLTHFWEIKWSLGTTLTFYLYKIPAVIQQFVPVACLMATLLVLTNMSRQNEILALYASGIGDLRLVSTFVAIVAAISTFSFLTFDSLVPAFTRREMMMQKGLDPSQEEALFYTNKGFWYRSGHVVYNVGRFVPDSNSLEDVRVYVMHPSFKVSQIVRAKRALYVDNDWVLQDGFSVNYPEEDPFPTTSKFEEMRHIIPEKPSDFKTLSVDEQTMRLKDLRLYIKRNKSYGLDTTGQQVSYHERLALVFAPLVFVLIGIPFATRPLKTQSFARSIGFCFVVIFFYLLAFRFSVSVGKSGHIPPLLAGWGPNLLFLLLSGFLIWRRRN